MGKRCCRGWIRDDKTQEYLSANRLLRNLAESALITRCLQPSSSMQRLPCYALSGGGPKRRPNRVEVWFADLPKLRVLLELDLTRERFASCSRRILEISSSLPAMSSFDASQAEHQRQSMGIRLTERPSSAEQKVYRFLMESLVGRAVPFLEFYPFPLDQIGEL